jgi:TRAP-type C4-dicarboxylate transport system substrate-binding protein
MLPRRRLLLSLPLCAWPLARAAEPTTLKIATIGPKGSIYYRVLQDLGEAWRNAAGGAARAIVYGDSVQGTEADMVRRMRIGQLDVAMLTAVGLHQIDPAVGALQFMPLTFRSWDEVDHVREALRPAIEERLAARGFVVLFWGEAGWVQFFTRERLAVPEDFRRARIFVYAGDAAQADLMKSLGYTPVPLPATDILPALQTGMVDAVPVSPMWALAGQLDRVTRHMLPINWVPIVGATVMRKVAFDALAPAAREAVLTAAERAAERLRVYRATHDEEAVRALQARGVTVHPISPEQEAAWQKLAAQARPHVRGAMVPADMFDRVQSTLAAYREARK